MGGRSWRVVICARPLDVAKSRLQPLGEAARRSLALAMTRDVLDALGATAAVSEVVLVSDDPSLTRVARAEGAVVLPDPGHGLNRAFLHGVGTDRSAALWTAMLMADLPCLSSDVLQRVLDAAGSHRTAVVPDRAGSGSALLAVAPGCRPRPRFGDGSFRRHVVTGAAPVGEGEPRARCDVDTQADLDMALALGVGPHTMRVATVFGLDRVSLNKQL